MTARRPDAVTGWTPKARRPLSGFRSRPFRALGKGLIDFTMKEPKAEKMS
jgi:hypothetical protein